MNSVRHPNRKASAFPAAVLALMRWHPNMPLQLIENLRERHPGYPLIHGGSPRVAAINNDMPAARAPALA